jgi:hypothetical protein
MDRHVFLRRSRSQQKPVNRGCDCTEISKSAVDPGNSTTLLLTLLRWCTARHIFIRDGVLSRAGAAQLHMVCFCPLYVERMFCLDGGLSLRARPSLFNYWLSKWWRFSDLSIWEVWLGRDRVPMNWVHSPPAPAWETTAQSTEGREFTKISSQWFRCIDMSCGWCKRATIRAQKRRAGDSWIQYMWMEHQWKWHELPHDPATCNKDRISQTHCPSSADSHSLLIGRRQDSYALKENQWVRTWKHQPWKTAIKAAVRIPSVKGLMLQLRFKRHSCKVMLDSCQGRTDMTRENARCWCPLPQPSIGRRRLAELMTEVPPTPRLGSCWRCWWRVVPWLIPGQSLEARYVMPPWRNPPIYQVPIDFFSSLTPSAVGIESSHVPAHNSCAT